MQLHTLILWFFAVIGFLVFLIFVIGLTYTAFRVEYNPVDEVEEALEEVENETGHTE